MASRDSNLFRRLDGGLFIHAQPNGAKLWRFAFCRSVAKQIAAMIASLGGIDMLVFSGGIGEHDADTRLAICADLAWAGVAQAGQGGRCSERQDSFAQRRRTDCA